MFKLREIKSKATSFLDTYKQRDPAAYAAAQEAVGGLLILDGFIGIDNPLGGKKRSGIFGSVSGMAVGVVLVFVGSFFLSVSGLNKMTATTTGTVTAVGAPIANPTSNGSSSSSCSLTVSYTVSGKTYIKPSSSSSSGNCGHSVGDTVTVYYNPNQPASWSADAKTAKSIIKIFPIVGIVVIILSLITFVIRLLSIIFGWKLLKSGRALAKTLPGGVNLKETVSQIRQEFKKHVFGGTPNVASPASLFNMAGTSFESTTPTPQYPPPEMTQPPAAQLTPNNTQVIQPSRPDPTPQNQAVAPDLNPLQQPDEPATPPPTNPPQTPPVTPA